MGHQDETGPVLSSGLMFADLGSDEESLVVLWLAQLAGFVVTVGLQFYK